MATGRAPIGKSVPTLTFYFKTPLGVKVHETAKPVDIPGKKYPNYWNGRLSPYTLNYGSTYYNSVAYMPPYECDKYLLPGWTQTSELLANITSSIALSNMTVATKEYILDSEMVKETAKKLAILHCLHFIKSGNPITVPDIAFYPWNYGPSDKDYQKLKEASGEVLGFTVGYDEAIKMIGMDQFAYVTPSQIGDPNLGTWASFDASALSSKKIWKLDPSSVQSEWGVLAKLGLESHEEAYKSPKDWILPPPPTLFSLLVKASDLNLRSEPSKSSKSLGKLKTGEVVYQISNPSDGWVEVCSKDLGYGFVANDPKYIEAISPEGEPIVSMPKTADSYGNLYEKEEPSEQSLKDALPKEEEEDEEGLSTGAKVAIGGAVVAAGIIAAVLMKRKAP